MTKTSERADSETQSLPTAQIRRRSRWTVLWLVPIFALGVAGWLSYREFIQTGYEIRIRFDNASGLEPGKSQIKFLGIPVGRVTELHLSEDRRHTTVVATLAHGYEDLAREGTQFWIVRPRLSGTRVRGLMTVASQNYLSLQLGGGEGRPKQFVGSESPPVTEETATPQPGLRIKLVASELSGLERGSPINYRGAEAGRIVSYEIADDGSAIEIEAFVKERFAPFIRPGTKFYSVSGFDLNAGLFRGVDFELKDLQSLAAGGVAFATPPGGGEQVKDGTTFHVYPEEREEWKEWMAEAAAAPAEESE